MYPKSMMDQIERIRAIDPEAADYLMGDEVRKLVTFGADASQLNEMFVWKESPQGDAYWRRIDGLTEVQ